MFSRSTGLLIIVARRNLHPCPRIRKLVLVNFFPRERDACRKVVFFLLSSGRVLGRHPGCEFELLTMLQRYF